MKPIQAVFIASVAAENTGGNCMADVIELKSGPVIFITDECIGIAANMHAWTEGPSEDYRGFEFEATGVLFRADECEGGKTSRHALTFVESITTYEPDGPVSVDLITLFDGRVIGVDSETMVLYPSMEAFDKFDGQPNVNYPTVALVEGGAA